MSVRQTEWISLQANRSLSKFGEPDWVQNIGKTSIYKFALKIYTTLGWVGLGQPNSADDAKAKHVSQVQED